MEVVIDGIVYVPKELEKKVEPVIVEKNYKFELHPIISNNKLQWNDVVAYAKSLGDGWRLPTIEECFIMYNNKVITGGVYWSSTENDDIFAWSFYFSNGNANFNYKVNSNYVRAVRSI
jgi:formylglycine-generating enzyme required for sulfatase activity